MTSLYFDKHFNQFQNRVFLIFNLFILILIISYQYSYECIFFFTKLLLYLKIIDHLIITEITEVLHLQIFISLIFTLIFTLWFGIFQFWLFFSNGFNKLKNFKTLKWYCFYLISFLFINYFIINYSIPTIWKFFITTNNPHLFFEPKLSNYIFLIINNSFMFNLILQYPFCIFNLLFIKFFKIKIFIKYRKNYYFSLWILILLLSPPDITTSTIFSAIFIGTMEFFIFLFYFNKSWNNKKFI